MRNILLDCALETFLEQGYFASSMAQIAKRAGISKQTLYNYFPEKPVLFKESVEREISRNIEQLFRPFDYGLIEDISEILGRFGRDYIAIRNTDRALALRRMMVADGYRQGIASSHFQADARAGWLRLAGYLKRGMDSGTLRSEDPWLATMLFQGMCESGPLQRRLAGDLVDYSSKEFADVVDQAVVVFLRAYRLTEPHTGDTLKRRASIVAEVDLTLAR